MSQSVTISGAVAADGIETTVRLPSMASCGSYLLVVIAALRTCGFVRTLRLIGWMTRGRHFTFDGSFDLAERLARRVSLVAALYPGRARCLEQSITLYWLLRRLKMDAVLRMGVQPVGFAAHAWVEYRGRPVLENELVNTVLPFPDLSL